ncbi:phage tail protein [Streptomyces triculaminicus]|uniref:phage tail protein n=1 Tax=Streptomyces triculaminicus TaxID=2816232 RepID=UPI0037D3013E
MATGQRTDPFAAFNFTLEVEGLSGSHGFSECSGAGTEQDVIEYREGTGDTDKKSGDITLKRGFTTNRDLWDWRRSVLEGQVIRRNGHLVLNDEAGKPALRWRFTNAWPKQYSAPSLGSPSSEVAVEELVLVVETIELDTAG